LNFQPPAVTTLLPNNGMGDSQFGFRARIKVGDLDIGLNYYYGRFGFPVAYDASVQVTTGGALTNVAYSAEVVYPRMHAAGFDFNYSAPWLFDIGFVGDFAVIIPEPINFALGIYENGATLTTITNQNVSSTPFVKAAVGADYSFTSWLYVNALYIHGFVDEFNDAYGLHDYVSLTPEFKVLHDRLKLRVATILDLKDHSNVVYPQLTWIVLPSVEVMLGAFILGGSTHPQNPSDYASRNKFGQLAAGRDDAVLRVKVSW
jgi:hypothetical protein